MPNLVKASFIYSTLAASLACSALATEVPFAGAAPVIDGRIDESIWDQAQWQPINVPLIGPLPAAEDFSGQYKLLWDPGHLYLLVAMRDDVLYDRTSDPLQRYWDDDCLEVFIDEDASGGDHLYNFNAFAYHIALDNQAVDIGGRDPQGAPVAMLFNDHVKSVWQRTSDIPDGVIWEAAIKIFDDTFNPKSDNTPVALSANKQLGFMLAYCDNDGGEQRESFVGSHQIEARNGDKNLGYKDASVFGRIALRPEK